MQLGKMTGSSDERLSRSASAAGSGSKALEGLCAALLPPEAGGPDPHELSRRIAAFVTRQPPFIGPAIKAGAVGIDSMSLLFTGRRLVANQPAEREAVLRRIARSQNAAAALDGLKAFVLLVSGSELAASEARSAVDQTGLARPDAEMDVTPAMAWPSFSRFDAVVVGSGAGGAMAARTLARAGLSVVVVEEGSRHLVDEFRSSHPLDRFASLYRDGGSTAALGRPPVVLPIGRGVGGTTLVNSGTCYRTPEKVMKSWRDDAGLALGDPDMFNPYLDEVWSTLKVGPVPLEVMGRNGLLALAGAEALGWRSGPLQRNAPGCDGCCQCAIGCPRNAKFGVHLNALPEACAAGARIVSEARVKRVTTEYGRATGIVAERVDGSSVVIEAPRVIVAAGTTETPPLLRRSGLGRHRRLGRNLALHPALGAAGRFEEKVVPWHGVLQSAGVEEFHESDGILVEATSTPPGMGSMVLPGYGRELLNEIAAADHLVTLGAMVADLPAGSVIGRNRTVIRYDLTERDARRLVKCIEVMGKILFAAGATEVLTGVPGYARVRDAAELDEAVSHADPRNLHLAAFHPVGTAAAGSDPERFPVDASGALRGVSGVWVTDGSVLPTCPEVNPQVSIMAMALAIADQVARRG